MIFCQKSFLSSRGAFYVLLQSADDSVWITWDDSSHLIAHICETAYIVDSIVLIDPTSNFIFLILENKWIIELINFQTL